MTSATSMTSMTKLVKICGVTRLEDAVLCAEAGADLLGFNFWPRSKRFVEPSAAAELAAAARAVNPAIEVVGVFVNASEQEIARASELAALDRVQLHGDESREEVAGASPRAFKAASVASVADVEAALAFPGELLLLDAPSAGYGGSGHAFNWRLCEPMRASGRRWLLAGGLTATNVAEAISVADPTGVDVASGVESQPGIKDPAKVRAFVAAAKGGASRREPSRSF